MKRLHRTKDGELIPIAEMDDQHLLNTIRLFKRKAKEGITVMSGDGIDAEDIWYDEEILYDEDAEEEMGLEHYIKEAKKRKLTFFAGD